MKKVFVGLILIFLFNITYSQQKIQWIDVDKIIETCTNYEQEGEFEKALKEVIKIPENDSVYISSLTTRMYYLINTDKYEEAIEVGKIGMNDKDHPFKYYFLLNTASAYYKLKQYQNSIDVYDEILKLYPNNYLAYYGKGIAYVELKDFDKASLMYQKSITLNPLYANSHLKLGVLCYQEHHITQAMMCLNMYLLINPEGEGTFDILQAYNNMVEVKNESEKHPGVKISEDDDSFKEIDLIINNYVALSKKYKIRSKLDFSLIRQNHAMMAQLKDYEGNGGFWDKYYVPFFKFINDNDHFDAFSYTISYSIENEKYRSIINKKIPQIKSFITDFVDEWLDIIGNNEKIINGTKKQVKYLYSNRVVNGIGVYEDEKLIGDWTFYNEYGGISAVGKFNNDGNKQGKWIWYDKFANIDEVGNFDNGIKNGEYLVYYKNGKIKLRVHYLNDSLNGKFEKFTEKEALSELYNYNMGKLDGIYATYYSMGKDFNDYKILYKNGLVDGMFYEYYPDGTLKTEVLFKDDKKEGQEKRYFNSGQIEFLKNFNNGQLEGEFTEYYANGEIYQKGNYIKDNRNGKWITNYNNGSISEEMYYDNGDAEGIAKEYDRDGILYCEYTYKKNNIIAYKFFNKDQRIIKQAKKQKGEFYYVGYNPYGNIVTKGKYDVKGGKNGVWKYYDENAVQLTVENRNDNKLEGVLKHFYPNRVVKSMVPYENDTLSGYYSDYYPNNKLKQQGWYHKGKLVGKWITYYLDGTVESENYYTNGKLYGLSNIYDAEGNLVVQYDYYDGDLRTEYYYNPEGEIFDSIQLNVDSVNYKLISKYCNGQVSSVFNMLYGKKHGDYISYNFDGSLQIEGKYYYGEPDSVWNWYNEDGTLSVTGSYMDGEKSGVWNYYHDNGKLSIERNYFNGKIDGVEKNYNEEGILTQTREYSLGLLNGEVIFYGEEGKLQLVRYYFYDRLIGYSYLDSNSELKPMIPIKNETANIVAYYDNGNISRQLEVYKGEFHNKYLEYYYNGQINEDQTYSYGNNEGADITYYPDGTVKSERNYSSGLLNGPLNEYYPNGKLKKTSTYLNGQLIGVVKQYNESGKLIKETTYFNEEPCDQKIF